VRCGAARLLWRVAVLTAGAALLLACGEGEGEPRATQTAARVNRGEITIHQINHVLQQQRGLKPEQAEAAGRQVLERLIEQQLAVERAGELDLDRDPRVVMQLEAARSAVLARAYLERVGEAAARPTPEELRRYYDERPALFAARRVYDLQELAVEADAARAAALQAKLPELRSFDEVAGWLRAAGYRFSIHQGQRAAEQLPPATLQALTAMSPGKLHLRAVGDGVHVLALAGSSAQPVTYEQAAPAIEQALLAERRRQLMQADVEALRAKARIDYRGRFAEAPPPAAAASR
jgi:EpsD family peptidyl-prolyl cis-trans isomerase